LRKRTAAEARLSLDRRVRSGHRPGTPDPPTGLSLVIEEIPDAELVQAGAGDQCFDVLPVMVSYLTSASAICFTLATFSWTIRCASA